MTPLHKLCKLLSLCQTVHLLNNNYERGLREMSVQNMKRMPTLPVIWSQIKKMKDVTTTDNTFDSHFGKRFASPPLFPVEKPVISLLKQLLYSPYCSNPLWLCTGEILSPLSNCHVYWIGSLCDIYEVKYFMSEKMQIDNSSNEAVKCLHRGKRSLAGF